MGDHELDVRPMRKPDKHPAIFQAYAALAAGESLVLVNDHDPRHLRDEFEIEHPGGYGWEYLARDRGAWRIRISKLASTPLPRVLADTTALGSLPDGTARDGSVPSGSGASGPGADGPGADGAGADGAGADGATGVIWKLQMRERDLDSNVIGLAPGAVIDAHAGPDVDVLIHVLAGSGQLATERDTLELRAGSLLWLPRRSRRQFTAGPDGLRYLTVHQRRQALTLLPASPAR